MSLTLYNTKLKPEHNARYESIDDYLATCDSAVFNDFQYIKPALSVYIKVPMSGYSRDTLYNYAKVIDPKGQSYYYFITSHKWVAEETLGLTLTLDTINTFWYDLRRYFVNKVTNHITRRFKNRFEKEQIDGINYIYPKIDRFTEDLNNPVLIRKSVETIGDNHLWYLVSKTDYDSSTVAKNPITTYLLKDEPIEFTNTSYTIYPSQISAGYTYVFEKISDVRKIRTTGSSGYQQEFSISTDNEYVEGYYFYENGAISLKLKPESAMGTIYYITGIAKLELLTVDHVIRQPLSFDPYPGQSLYNSNYTSYTDILYIYAQEGNTTVPSFSDWYKENKTDTTLIKIVCLPYNPFNYELVKYKINVDYVPTGYGIRIINPNVKFADTVLTDVEELPTYVEATTCHADQSYNLEYETKRFNSAYYSLKYVYDNNYIVYNLEDFNESKDSYTFNITFIYNTEMSNSLAFKFSTSDYRYDTDYGEYIIANKTLDVPFFTNEYLNYLRYGKSVDERNMKWSVASALTGGASTTINSIASLKAIGQGSVSWIGKSLAGVGVVSTVLSVASTLSKAKDAINLKIDTYTHQASSVNGSSDVSVFTEYSGNKLLKIKYEAPDELLTPILDYFRLYGYATDEYGKLTSAVINSRYYHDFVQAEIDVTGCTIDSEYLDDFKERFASGLRIYHWHDGYDLDMNKENWEYDLIV